MQPLRGPDAELRAALRLHAKTDSDDHVEIEVLDLVGLPVGTSCCRTCNNCLAVELPLDEHIPDVP